MFSIKAFPFLAVVGLTFVISSTASAQISSESCKSTVIQYEKEKLTSDFDDLRKFNITEDWGTQGLETGKMPLSVPVRLENPIMGETVGVFDRNWKKDFRVSSFWGRNIIRIRIQTRDGSLKFLKDLSGLIPGADALPGVNMLKGGKALVPSAITGLGLQNKDGYIIISGCDGVFNVTKEIADALVDYPLSGKRAFILLSNDGSTGLRINEIGSKTVEAWKVVYRDWNPVTDGIKKKVIANKMMTPKRSIEKTKEEVAMVEESVEKVTQDIISEESEEVILEEFVETITQRIERIAREIERIIGQITRSEISVERITRETERISQEIKTIIEEVEEIAKTITIPEEFMKTITEETERIMKELEKITKEIITEEAVETITEEVIPESNIEKVIKEGIL